MSADSLREQIAGVIASRRGVTARVNDTDRLIADRVLALLGEVTVTEEWAIRYADGDFDGGYESRGDAEQDRNMFASDEPTRILRRTVTRTERVGDWEEVQ